VRLWQRAAKSLISLALTVQEVTILCTVGRIDQVPAGRGRGSGNRNSGPGPGPPVLGSVGGFFLVGGGVLVLLWG